MNCGRLLDEFSQPSFERDCRRIPTRIRRKSRSHDERCCARRKVKLHFGVNFEQIGQMLAAFTPKRWELIAALRQAGPLTLAELARRLNRDYKNVHTDVNQMIEWMAVERVDDGRLNVPWSEIVVDMKLTQRMAA